MARWTLRPVMALIAVALATATGLAQVPASPPAAPSPTEVLTLPADPFASEPFPPAANPLKATLPGSPAELMARDYAAREGLFCCTANGVAITLLPQTLLWEPPFAIKREPRMQVLPIALENYDQTWSLETSLGTTVGIVRWQWPASPYEWQVDLFGVCHTRLSPEDLLLSDYRFGFPLSVRRGAWHAKLAYEHTSAHVGDEGIINGQYPVSSFAKDEIVVGAGRWFNECLRLYGQVSYAFFQDLPDETVDRWRFDIGFELYDRRPTGMWGTPFLAANADFRGDQRYNGNFNVQTGWLWRNPEVRLSEWRMFVEYYTGRSPYGQFFTQREQFFGAGLAVDY